MSTTPAAPGPPPSGPPPGSTGRLIAIVIAVVLGIGLLTAAGLLVVGLHFASRVHVSERRDGPGEHSVKIDTPFGRLRVQKGQAVDPKLIGIPLYPGAAVVQDDSSARVDLDLDFADKSLRVLAAEMETPDSFDQVVDFYRREAADFTFTQKSPHKAGFLLERGRSKKVVGIAEKNGRTRISLANVGEPEAN